jgi:hypothetical protein
MKHYGFIAPEIKREDYLFGAENFHDPILMPNGHGWGAYLPQKEIQRNQFIDTFSCSSYGTINAIETIMRFKYSGEYDYSDRYVAKMSGTVPSVGNAPDKVLDTIRKVSGLVPQSSWDFNDTIKTQDEYFANIPNSIISLGKEWLLGYQVKREWVDGDPESLMDALQYSPIGIGVWAWSQDARGYYIRPAGKNDIHWCMLYDYVKDDHFLIYDSYDNTIKKLDWNFGFKFCMRYAVLFADPVSKRDSVIYLILDKLTKVLELMIAQLGKITGGLRSNKTTNN